MADDGFKLPQSKKQAIIESGRFLRNLFGGGGKKKVTPLPKVDREYPMVPREAIERAATKAHADKLARERAIWDHPDAVKYRGRPYLATPEQVPKKLTWKEAWGKAKPDKKALAAAGKANQPVGKTQTDLLREYVEAGGYNVPAGGLPDQAALDRAIARLKKRTRKATPAEAELIPKLNKDEFEAALKSADEVPLSKPLTAGADEVPLSEPLPASFTESVEANLERLASEGVEQGVISPEVKEIIMRSYRGKGKKP